MDFNICSLHMYIIINDIIISISKQIVVSGNLNCDTFNESMHLVNRYEKMITYIYKSLQSVPNISIYTIQDKIQQLSQLNVY